MDIYSLIHKWTSYQVDSQKKKKLTLQERKELLNEISYEAAEKIERWFEQNPEALSFDDLFEGSLRKIIPLDSPDSKMLRHVIEMLKSEGWQIPQHPEWKTPTFQVKSVKHVDTELQGQGGGARSYFKEIANLELEKVEERVIPAGPRQGEKITSRKKLSMSKIIARSKVLRKDDKKWWQQKQQYYAKDGNWNLIEGLMNSTVKRSQHVVLSRHPMDVLRMSDIDEIESCHSEGREYFECAVHEAQGHGPIAYLVDSDQLVYFLNRYAGDEEYDYDLQDEPEERNVWTFGTPEDQIAKIKKYYIENEKLKPRLDRLYRDREHVDFDFAIEHRWANSAKVYGPLMVRVLKNHYEGKPLETDVEGYGETKPAEEPKEEEIYDLEKLNGMLNSLDDQEVFRDHDRDVDGLGAAARVRLRKFEDTENEIQFAVPEKIVYGPHPPGFVPVVMDWAWNNQKELFLRDNVPTFFPDADDIGRHGGRWEDTKDGKLLNLFFANAPDFNKERDGYGEYNLRALGEMDRADDLLTIENQVRDMVYMFDHHHEEKGITVEARVVEMDSWDNELAFNITSNAKIRLELDFPFDETATGRHGDLIPFPEYDSEETITDGKLEKIKSTIVDYGSRALEALSDLNGWRRVGGKLYIYLELEHADGGFSSIEDFEYWISELESYVDGYDEDQPKAQAENMIAERFREMNLFPEENLTVFAKALKGLNEELEEFEMYGVEFDGDEITEIEDIIEIECNFREVFKVSEKLTSMLNKDLLKQMFGPGIVRQKQTAEMHPRTPTTYFTLRPARRGKFSQLLEKRMKKIMASARKAVIKDLRDLDPKYDRMKFFNAMRHIADAEYGLKINDSAIDYYIKFEFEKQHTKEFLFGVLDYAKYLDKNIDQIDKAFKLAIEEIFADFLEYIKTHKDEQTEDDEEFGKEL